MNRNRAHAAYPTHPVTPRFDERGPGICYACGKPIAWDGRRWLHTPTPVKGKR